MNQELLELIDNKLAISLKRIDENVSSNIINEWSVFSPDPNCPTGGSVQERIKNICARGFSDREKAAAEQLEHILTQHGSLLNKKLSTALVKLLKEHFPDDKYVAVSSKTEGVFIRKNAPQSRLAKEVVELNQSLIAVAAKNMSRSSLHALTQIVNDHGLRARKGKKSFTQSFLHVFTHCVAIPSIKWTFGIISAVVVAVLTYKLTGKS